MPILDADFRSIDIHIMLPLNVLQSHSTVSYPMYLLLLFFFVFFLFCFLLSRVQEACDCSFIYWHKVRSSFHTLHCIQCIAMYCNATIVCQREICKNRFYNYLCDFVLFLESASVKPHTHNLVTWSSYSFPGLLCLLFLITYCEQSKTGGKNGL